MPPLLVSKEMKIFILRTFLRNLSISLAFYGEIALCQSNISRKEKTCLLKNFLFFIYCRTLSQRFTDFCQKTSGKVVETTSTCPEEHYEEKQNFLKKCHFSFFLDCEKKFSYFWRKIIGMVIKTAVYVSIGRNILEKTFLAENRFLFFFGLFGLSAKIFQLSRKEPYY